MNYQVFITAQALEELDAAYNWLVELTPQHGPEWYNRLLDAIHSLEHFPTRCPVAPENRKSDEDVRHLIVGDRQHGYRVIFVVRGSTVVILDILHGARNHP
jgi:plasmid stabilization system protein ParE